MAGSEIELVGLHGFAGSGSLWRGLRCRGRWWAPDLVGHGRSRSLRVRDFEAEVERLEGLRVRRGSGRRILVGYSLGARVGLRWLCRFPDSFVAAVLVGVSPGLDDRHARTARVGEDARWIDLLNRQGTAAFAEQWQALPLFASQQRLPPALWRRQQRGRRRQDAGGLAHSLEVLGLGVMPPLSNEDCRRMELPVVVVAGGEDHKYVALGRELAQRLPQGRLVVVPRCGHNVVLEAPVRLAALIDEVVEEVERWRG